MNKGGVFNRPPLFYCRKAVAVIRSGYQRDMRI